MFFYCQILIENTPKVYSVTAVNQHRQVPDGNRSESPVTTPHSIINFNKRLKELMDSNLCLKNNTKRVIGSCVALCCTS